ncbi:MAG: hypothetical protein EOO92_00120 [Pedobacter sp.]|nr:MAG: hypothetical protein EOO92_00120 [Pedobacter sp.]
MQNILIPTDFNLSALNCIPALCNQYPDEKLSFFFVHMFKLSDSITDLLMLSRRSREFEQVDDEFYNSCNELRAKYPQIECLKVDFLYGSTLSMFKNFLEDNEINKVLDPSNCSVNKINKSSIDPTVLISKSSLPVIKVQEVKPEPVREVVARVEEEELIGV